MLAVESLRKSYSSLRAVDDVSYTIAKGETFGLLGPNGAGKTTTIQIMVGAIRADAGRVRIDGDGDPTQARARRALGLAPQALALYDKLTAEENLAFYGRLYGLAGARLRERVEWCLAFAGLTERRRARAGTFS